MITSKKLSFEEKVLKHITHIRDKKLIVSCSGGPDSMVLLDLLRENFGEDAQKNLIVAHIYHGLRDSAERDQTIVNDYCQKYHLTYECLRVDIKKIAQETKTTIEECARNVRKEWLEKIRTTYQADFITTAHHSDDQSETLLYRITKGTSITGLVGIEPETDHYIRPLLSVGKSDILSYAQVHKIPYGLDETNDDTAIPRNLLRHEVLPRLRTINPELSTALTRLSQSSLELKEGFNYFFRDIIQEKKVDYDWYRSLPVGFQHECLRCLYESVNGSTHGLSRALIEEYDRFLSTCAGGKKEFGHSWLVKKQGAIYIDKYKK